MIRYPAFISPNMNSQNRLSVLVIPFPFSKGRNARIRLSISIQTVLLFSFICFLLDYVYFLSFGSLFAKDGAAMPWRTQPRCSEMRSGLVLKAERYQLTVPAAYRQLPGIRFSGTEIHGDFARILQIPLFGTKQWL